MVLKLWRAVADLLFPRCCEVCGRELMLNEKFLCLECYAQIPFTYFWKMEELPEGVKPIYAMCNGCMVQCYFRTMEHDVEFYRPNSNAKNVYIPLSFEEMQRKLISKVILWSDAKEDF